ncbi:putative quinol monooxygenase [Chelativorans salis]|uniref:putative quinol monooxygenase n=1 Tax=Chelativorans salis TaxID=2978478 RepID=UPI003CC595F5
MSHVGAAVKATSPHVNGEGLFFYGFHWWPGGPSPVYGKSDGVVAANVDLIRRACAYPGCLDLSISEDPVDTSRVKLMDLWESEAVLEAWRKISNLPQDRHSVRVSSLLCPSRTWTTRMSTSCSSGHLDAVGVPRLRSSTRRIRLGPRARGCHHRLNLRWAAH